MFLLYSITRSIGLIREWLFIALIILCLDLTVGTLKITDRQETETQLLAQGAGQFSRYGQGRDERITCSENSRPSSVIGRFNCKKVNIGRDLNSHLLDFNLSLLRSGPSISCARARPFVAWGGGGAFELGLATGLSAPPLSAGYR